jgi:hypothetical protein
MVQAGANIVRKREREISLELAVQHHLSGCGLESQHQFSIRGGSQGQGGFLAVWTPASVSQQGENCRKIKGP